MEKIKTGIELISQERDEQIEKHGRTIEKDVEINTSHQLTEAVAIMVKFSINTERDHRPLGWDRAIWQKMVNKPYIERLVIAGALIAAEIDRRQAIQKAL